jgi:hypothetical protein
MTRIRQFVRRSTGINGAESPAVTRLALIAAPMSAVRKHRGPKPVPAAARPARPRVDGLEGKTKHDFEVVVSRDGEDVSWVEPMWSDHATIYDKSEDALAKATDPGHAALPNVGQEAGTYLYHIVSRWGDHGLQQLFAAKRARLQ